MPRRNSSRFVTVTKEEFESWLADFDRRMGWAWAIVEDDRAQEYIYDVRMNHLNNEVSVRIYSSVDKRTGVTRDIGTDAIRIVYWDRVNNMPLGKGRKMLRTISASSTIHQRLRVRLKTFFDGIRQVRPVNFEYVKYVIARYLEIARPSRRSFAESLLQQLETTGSLSSKQVSYVVGEENPRGWATFEKILNDRGDAPGVGFERQEANEENEAYQQAEFEAARSDRPDNLFPEDQPNIMPGQVRTGRTTASSPNIQIMSHAHDINLTDEQREEIRNILDARGSARQAGPHVPAPVHIEEESDRMVDELDRFVRSIDGPEPVLVVGEHNHEDFVSITELSERFGDNYTWEFLNPVQSAMFNEALEPDCNTVISASTSAGKTVCAEMVADRMLEEGYRVVYLSPLKSLTQEKYADWQNLWPDKNICILTGDYVLSQQRKEELQDADIIVMTSEMCDSRTRRMRREGNRWLEEVGVIIVDEAHILTTDRGHAVETGIMRFASINPGARIMLLSATMPNVEQLGRWLTTLNDKETKVIKSQWRPVELEFNYPMYNVVTRANGSMDYHETQLAKIDLACNIVNSSGLEDQKFLVFVHDKNTGRRIVRKLEDRGINAKFHNANLDMQERLGIEKQFQSRRRGSLRVLVSTSTLAWGRNLPARNVIIVGAYRGINEVDPLDLIQMAGRAGRYGIDDRGTVFMLTPENQTNLYQDMLTNPRPITSVLAVKETLAFHMLAEMQNRVVTGHRSFVEWFKRSFASYSENTTDSQIEALCQSVIQDMLDLNMIQLRSSAIDSYQCTQLGSVSAWLYYSPYDIAAWHRNFTAYFSDNVQNSEEEPVALAWAFANIPSFDFGYCPKDLDRTYNELHAMLSRNMLHLSVGLTPHVSAAFAMVQGIEPASPSVKIAASAIRYDFDRMMHAIRLIDKRVAQWGADMKTVAARLKYGIGPELVPLVQIKGVGAKRAKKLYDSGLKTIKAVASPAGKRKMLRIFKPALVNKIYAAAKKANKERRR